VDDTKSSNNIRVNELKQEIVDELRNELATKADIADLKATMAEMKATMAEMKVNFATKAEIAESKTDIIKWLSAFQITVVSVAVAIIKLF
ncbi:hypothetical protein CQA37_06150, partial [Helicobacter sp. MIT 99-10781]|uniref:hypothetical protein n=1 Tax=Helicobacter sp. MIT 99-10781 TaxID=1332285 RepID=UPI000E36511D